MYKLSSLKSADVPFDAPSVINAAFKLVTLKEPSLYKAIRYTFKHAGKAIIINSSILVCGFFTLLFSSFDGTFYTGLLIGLTLIFGIAAEIFLLPVLLLYFYKPEKHKKNGMVLKEKTPELKSELV